MSTQLGQRMCCEFTNVMLLLGSGPLLQNCTPRKDLGEAITFASEESVDEGRAPAYSVINASSDLMLMSLHGGPKPRHDKGILVTTITAVVQL